MPSRITIYQKPTCTTCRQTAAILREAGISFDEVNYYLKPLSTSKLRALLHKMRISPRELLRTREPLYKKLHLENEALSNEELCKLMVTHPDLIQRPIVEKGNKAILARPASRIKELL